MKCPELSFGNKNQAWIAISFGDAFEFCNNKAISREQLNYDEGEVKSIHYGDILTKFPHVLDSAYPLLPYVNDEIDVSKVSLLKTGDVAIADTAEDYMVGKAIEISISDDSQLIAGLHVMACRPKINFAPGFLGYYLNSNAFHMQLRKLVTGTKVFAINKSEIRKTKLSFPEVEEQQKIASFFSTLDEKISIEEKKLDSYENLKTGLLQELFSNKNTADWESCSLDSISDIKTGPFGSTLHAKDYVKSGTPIVTTEHFKNGFLPNNGANIPQISDDDVRRLKSYKLELGDIVFSRVGSVDINAITKEVNVGWLFSGRVLRVRAKETILPEFIHYALSTSVVKHSIISRAVGLTMASINTKILGDTLVKVPPSQDLQRKIADILSASDRLIILQKSKINYMKKLKKGLMQSMFI